MGSLILVLALLGSPGASCMPGSTMSPGPLTPAHAFMDCATSCKSCHELVRDELSGVRDSLCAQPACHTQTLRAQLTNEGIHGTTDAATKECWTCHSEHHGVEALTHTAVVPTPISPERWSSSAALAPTWRIGNGMLLVLVLAPLGVLVAVAFSVLGLGGNQATGSLRGESSPASRLRSLAAARDPGRLSEAIIDPRAGDLSAPANDDAGRVTDV